MMYWHYQPGIRTRGSWGGLACVLLLLVCWPAQGQAARASQTRGILQAEAERRVKVMVVQGRLSVDLKDAELRTVLEQIAKQVGFTLLTGPIEHKTVSVQFTDVPLEQGLRRLLRLTALNHAMRSAPDAAGLVALQELRVFAEGDPRSLRVGAGRDIVVQADQAQQPEPTATTPTAPVQGELQVSTNPFLDALRRHHEQQPAQPPPGEAAAEPQVSTNPFLEVLRRHHEQQPAQPPPGEAAGVGAENPLLKAFSQQQKQRLEPGQREETPGRGLGQKP